MSGATLTPTVAEDDRGPARRDKRLLLAVCCFAQFLVILDLSIVIIALPSMQAGLLIAPADLQWVVDAYAIVFAGFLMLAGRASDVLGQRRIFVLALSTFALASLAGGLAPTGEFLIVARGMQGLAAAGMAAASLAIITASFAPGAERARAIALWGMMNGLGGAAGLLAGGLLTELSWRWVLLVTVPFAVIAAVIAAKVVVDRRRGRGKSFDITGALVLTAGLLVATYGGVTAGSEGWTSPEALVPIGIGSALLLLFRFVEGRASAPLLPPKALTPQLRAINVIVLLFSAAIFSMWFVTSLYMQQVLALTPLETGVTFLPMALVIFACASQAGRLVNRVGVRPVLGGGLILLASGLLLFTQASDGGSPLQYVVLPGVLTAIGIGFSVVASTVAATHTAGPEQAGLMSALVNTARQVGGGLGLAVLVSIATRYTSELIGGGNPVEESLTDGFTLAYLVGAGLTIVAAVMTFVLLPKAAVDSGQRRLGRRVVAVAMVIVAGFALVGLAPPRSGDEPIGAFTTAGAYIFASEPGLHPPQLRLDIPTPENRPLPGLIMTANFYDLTKGPMVGQSGPLILDERLQPVWFKALPTDVVASNLEVHTWRGEPVLAWWQGVLTETGEVSSGTWVIVDENYQTIATLEGADGWILSLHELEIEGDSAWITAYKNVQADLSHVGGVSNGVFVDSAAQRYDLRTGELEYSWNASDHIDLEESETQPPTNGFPWDAYHINSIFRADDGKMLLSMRNTSAGYLVDVESGQIEWRLGGKRSSFELPASARFEWQHDIELHPGSVVTLFDNHCCELTGAGVHLPPTGPSRGLSLKLDQAAGTATEVAEFSHGVTFNAQYMGNMQTLPGGGAFIGWGQVPYMSAFSPSGELYFDGALPDPNMTYRAYVQRWEGMPLSDPQCVTRTKEGGATVYASWNGATQLAAWNVLRGNGADAQPVVEESKSGFETAMPIPGSATGLTVQALDDAGRVIGSCQPGSSRE